MREFLRENGSAVETGWHVLAIVVLAFALRAVLHRAITKVITEAVESTVPVPIRPLRGRGEPAPLLTERRRQRAETIGSVLKSITSVVVFTVAIAMVLGEFGFDLGPFIASAGVIGVALGFGAQNLVRDYLNGMFMILEDQFGVGDSVDAGAASGVVEAVGLRVTRLRADNGTVWHIRNGEILRLGNLSQGWTRVLLDVAVPADLDTDRAARVVSTVADEAWRDAQLGGLLLQQPEVWGVQDLGELGLAVRLVVRCAPQEQWAAARELRRRLRVAFDEAGIELPVPHRALWLRTDPDAAPALVPDDAQAADPAT